MGFFLDNRRLNMSDILQSYSCIKCNHSVIEFDPPSDECESCGQVNSYRQCAIEVNTTLATEGIFCEYTLDNAYTLDERNDRFTDELLEDKAIKEVEAIRSGRIKLSVDTLEK
jgi:hypothetical protein